MASCPYCGTTLNPDSRTCPACGKAAGAPPPLGALPPPLPRAQSKTPWGVIIAVGCFGGIAFLGIIAALLVPNFLDALQKAKTKRTMADLRAIGTAIETYRVEKGTLPAGDSVPGLLDDLSPYLAQVPFTDGWERELRYQCWSQYGDPGCSSYRLASAGRDGVFEHDDLSEYVEEETPREDYDRDLVYGDGFFVQFPGSPQ